MSRIKSPCYKCEQRYVGCHSYCEAYKNYRKENAQIRSVIKSAKARNADITYYVVKAVKRMQKKKEIMNRGCKKDK